ncbi:hypothetical protein M409DRAFT_63449 [Zasmidium cellare ATCC 36951]|uniref:Fe2OG dioxygenase domain-containing protein n=1 Tax=Zasmidium cellare ATCC 36951 TaxID=1080233 RepID=A0A6A6D1F1_ZASCE|nr:uncharacterized protein M409DRAFT_63449 [Zasmidium cellare ATCC 36951]KAF2171909.1 hypothetical protein M409DRAFT_63449 [Zasmidium cellare ATCC 36951]
MGSITPTTTSSSEEDLTFPNLPPFPTDVPTVPLLRISLKNLLAGDPAEEEKLWRACCDLGFFYFDLRGGKGGDEDDESVDGDALLSVADRMFGLGEEVFALDGEVKEGFSMMGQNSYFGYKGYGAFVDRGGNKDRNEFWNISKDDILGIRKEPLPNPEVLMRGESRGLVKRYMLGSHALVSLILGVLNRRLGLPEGTLPSLHDLHTISGDQVRWVRSPPQPPSDRRSALGEHTDYGSVTILFNRLGGLQVLPPSDPPTWAYVKPLRGHCIVNLGDAMVKFTAGVLRSNIHRVANPPGAQAGETRLSLVYFNRPGDEVILKVLEGSEVIEERRRESGIDGEEGEGVTAKAWILNRAFGRAKGTEGDRLEKRDSGVAAS